MGLGDPQVSTMNQTRAAEPAATVPLCVDLDGTLIATDSSWEAALLLAKQRPLDLLRFPFWIAKGRAHLKSEMFARVMPDASLLPYRQDVVEMLRAEKSSGRRLILATGSDQRMAAAVCEHLGLFDEYVASDGVTNMTRQNKLAELQRRSGGAGFDYAGNSAADLCLWREARQAYVVDASDVVMRQARQLCSLQRVFDYPGTGARQILQALRPHQWLKNLLIFIPLILAHQLHHRTKIEAVTIAFLAFSFSASALYIINDLLDLESDRKHPTKRNRPFAAGKAHIPAGLATAVGMLIAAVGISLLVPRPFLRDLLIYVGVTAAYSFWLKRKLLVDVIVLAGLYTLRIIAGAAAADVELTMWLLAFSMFFFLSLAFAKRYAELLDVQGAGDEAAAGRGYLVTDLRIIESVGPASGYLAVMVFCNYLESSKVVQLYHRPHFLWLVAPILLYWITRIWFVARRGGLDQDPILFAIRDRRSYACGILAAIIVVMATMGWHIPLLGL